MEFCLLVYELFLIEILIKKNPKNYKLSLVFFQMAFILISNSNCEYVASLISIFCEIRNNININFSVLIQSIYQNFISKFSFSCFMYATTNLIIINFPNEEALITVLAITAQIIYEIIIPINVNKCTNHQRKTTKQIFIQNTCRFQIQRIL